MQVNLNNKISVCSFRESQREAVFANGRRKWDIKWTWSQIKAASSGVAFEG